MPDSGFIIVNKIDRVSALMELKHFGWQTNHILIITQINGY